MAEQRQPFRFRLPWLSMTAAPLSTPEPQPSRRPTPETQATARPTNTIPIQRAPFRPEGIAPPQPSFQAQTTSKTEPQPPPPPSQTATESRVASQPASPSRADQTRSASVPQESRVTSQPASSSRADQTRASSVPPPESQVTSQTVSPSRGTTQSPVAYQMISPSHAATQSRADSVPSSPSRTAQIQPATQTSPQPQSPSQLAPQSKGQTSLQPSSPMRKAIRGQPTDRAVSQSLSPPKKFEPPTKETSQPPFSIADPLSTVSQETETKDTSQPPATHPLSSLSPEKESKPAASLQLPQEPQPKTEIKSQIVPGSQYQTEGETTFKPETTEAQPMTTVVPTYRATPGAPAAPEKLESIPITASHPRSLAESEIKMKGAEWKKDKEEFAKEAKPEDGKEVEQELVKEEKPDSSAEEKMPRTITELLTAATGLERPSKELLGTKIKTEERKREKHEIFERKKPLTTSKSEEKHIKTVTSTHAKDRNILRNHLKPDISNGERAPLHKEIKEDISKFVHTLAIGHSKQLVDDDRPVSIITVAGENRGASMRLGAESDKKDGSVPIHRDHKLKLAQIPEATNDGEESSKGRRSSNSTTKNDQATRAYINSNIQSINNSITLHSSIDERNPGVHLVVSHNVAEPSKLTTKPGTHETHNAEFSITAAEKLTYEPTVSSQCLRGIFMEPSNSDSDNPEEWHG